VRSQAYPCLSPCSAHALTSQHYDLVIKTDLHTSPPTFSGEALITLDVHSDISKIVFNLHKTLHISHMAISHSDLKSTNSIALPASELSFDDEQERGILSLASLPGGELKGGVKDVKLFFKFDAELLPSMRGYYKSEGDADENGKKPM
jgi:aminopeptidase 2